jgi:adenylate kinase family enzyme
MSEKIIITGAYGVGKSEFASQLALTMAPCYLADLDVINPYFRPREQADWLKTQGVEVVGSLLKNHINQDFPALSGAISGIISQNKRIILDMAGSENGLRPLATFFEDLKDAQVWLVVNLSRPESMIDKIEDMVRLFEERSKLRITGFVHNTHMLEYTTSELIIESQRKLKTLSEQLQIPIVYTMINESIAKQCENEIENPILTFKHLILRADWMKGASL